MSERNMMAEELQNERVRKFSQFLDGSELHDKIRKMLNARERRLTVSVDDLRQFDREYTKGLLKTPIDYFPAFEKALKEISLTVDQRGFARDELERSEFHIGLEGSFGDHYVNPRTLSAKHLGKTIMIEGIVTKCSLVRPKVVRSVHYCEATQLFHQREYRDHTTMGSIMPTPAIYPKTDDEGNKLTTEYGYCTYRDYQTISIQEMPERAPAGLLPRPLDVVLDDDLVDKCKPGDRVCIVGVYRSVGKGGSSVSSTFRTILIANQVRLINRDAVQPEISEQDVTNIRKLSKREDIFELLSQSLAPSIYNTTNMKYIKKAVLLQLLGGMERNLPNGTHIRGDVNLLMVGDPSTAKSQMLRFVYKIAPLAVTTTGRGSSGVGLTAAVTTDKETGERRLEAGAMVLADRGIVCIDEFDKMNDNDRVAIHEVMEQQTVTIAKAGIHTTLNARCSVIAAANPAYGQYIDRRKPFENIALPDSLLSRFDLLFIVTDDIDEEMDKHISEHVLRMHRYTPPDVEEGTPINDSYGNNMSSTLLAALQPDNDEENDPNPFERFNKLLHAHVEDDEEEQNIAYKRRSRKGKKSSKTKSNTLKLSFIKKYLHYAKSRVKPVLTPEANDFIANTYADLRNRKLEEEEHRLERTLPVTARMLETLIRLATAHAKARLSQQVTTADAEVAKELLEYVLYKEVKQDPRKNKRRRLAQNADDANNDESDFDSDASESEESDNEDDEVLKKRGTKSRPTTAATTDQLSSLSLEDSQNAPLDSVVAPVTSARNTPRHKSRKSTGGPGTTSQGFISDLIESTSQRVPTQSESMEVDTDAGAVPSTAAQTINISDIDADRIKLFRQTFHRFREANSTEEEFTVSQILQYTNSQISSSQRFDVDEVMCILRDMDEQGQVLVTETGKIIVI